MRAENKQDPTESSVGEYSSLTANLRGVAKQAVEICTVDARAFGLRAPALCLS